MIQVELVWLRKLIKCPGGFWMSLDFLRLKKTELNPSDVTLEIWKCWAGFGLIISRRLCCFSCFIKPPRQGGFPKNPKATMTVWKCTTKMCEGKKEKVLFFVFLWLEPQYWTLKKCRQNLRCCNIKYTMPSWAAHTHLIILRMLMKPIRWILD